MRLLKHPPKHKPGYSMVMHLSPTLFEPDHKGRLCHVVLGYSLRKSDPMPDYGHKSETELLRELNKEIRNAKRKK